MYVGSIVATLAVLHPLEYVAMNTFAGGDVKALTIGLDSTTSR